MDGDPRLDCRVCWALKLPLGVVPHLQGEDPMADEGMYHPCLRQALALQVLDHIQQVGHALRVLLGR